MRFVRDRRFEQQLLRQQRFKRALAAAAEPARQRAEAFARAAGAPWMPRKGTGSTDVVVMDTSGDTPRLVNTDHAGHLQEWGSANNPPHAPLRRGARAGGLRLDERT
jgi:hypothetical protein